MSAGGAIGRREVAVRCFAAEYEDATLEYSEGDEERAPNYVVTPTGARINRLFVVGVLTEVEPVSDEVVRGRVVDPTGAFVVYAGQYQPDAKAALERTETPAFVAVTGKARTFRPDDGDRVYTSVRPESVAVVDADTRDRWTVQAAEHTLGRVETCAAALAREERGDALTAVLRESGVDPAQAAGIPRAIDHYGTTKGYLAAIRRLALQAAELVAGEREEVEPLEVTPDEAGTTEVDLGAEVALSTPPDDVAAAPSAPEGTTAGGSGGDAAEEPAVDPQSAGSDPADADEAEAASDATGADTPSPDESASGEEVATSPGAAAGEPSTAADATEDTGSTELYEMDEAEREAVEAEFGTEFETGNEVDAPGEADIEPPAGEPGADPEPGESEAIDVGEAGGGEPTEQVSPDAPSADQGGPDDEEAPPATEESAGDLVDAAVAAMGDLDDGEGADRTAVVESVASARGVDDQAVEAAIQEALMGGRCYEPDDGLLKAI